MSDNKSPAEVIDSQAKTINNLVMKEFALRDELNIQMFRKNIFFAAWAITSFFLFISVFLN